MDGFVFGQDICYQCFYCFFFVDVVGVLVDVVVVFDDFVGGFFQFFCFVFDQYYVGVEGCQFVGGVVVDVVVVVGDDDGLVVEQIRLED